MVGSFGAAGAAPPRGKGRRQGGLVSGGRPRSRKRVMRIERRYTTEGKSPYAAIPFRTVTSEIRNPDGSVVFRLEDIAVPESWSQVAADVLAQKYFRKA